MLERLTPGDRLMAKAGLKGVHREDCRRHGRDPYDTPILPPKNENEIGVFCKSFIIRQLALRFFLCSPYSPLLFSKEKENGL
jgi:hypothetical protein